MMLDYYQLKKPLSHLCAVGLRGWSSETNSVQSAFDVTPRESGKFVWSPQHDTVTFTPREERWAPLTNIIVRVSNSARAAASGNTLFATYELRFQTAALEDHAHTSGEENPETKHKGLDSGEFF